eukprot:1665426-Rhodomonas_salina.1
MSVKLRISQKPKKAWTTLPGSSSTASPGVCVPGMLKHMRPLSMLCEMISHLFGQRATVSALHVCAWTRVAILHMRMSHPCALYVARTVPCKARVGTR